MRDIQIIHWSVSLVVISSFTGTSYGAGGGAEGPASIALVILFPDTPFIMMLKTTSGAVKQLLCYPRGRTGELDMETLDR